MESAHWMQVRTPQAPSSIPPALLGLDQGELDTILLAQELQVDRVLIDEKLGRKVARSLGLPVQGTLGLLLAAYQGGLLERDEAWQAVQRLQHSTVHLSSGLVAWFETQINLER